MTLQKRRQLTSIRSACSCSQQLRNNSGCFGAIAHQSTVSRGSAFCWTGRSVNCATGAADHTRLLEYQKTPSDILRRHIAFEQALTNVPVYASGLGSSGRKMPQASWHDADIAVEGPTVAEFQRLFIDEWVRAQTHRFHASSWNGLHLHRGLTGGESKI
jgi:hypothetical protein